MPAGNRLLARFLREGGAGGGLAWNAGWSRGNSPVKEKPTPIEVQSFPDGPTH
jgi:hypothetical protein